MSKVPGSLKWTLAAALLLGSAYALAEPTGDVPEARPARAAPREASHSAPAPARNEGQRPAPPAGGVRQDSGRPAPPSAGGAINPGGAGNPGGPRFAPRPDNARVFRGAIPGQYRAAQQRGMWRGPPPGRVVQRPLWDGGNWHGGWWPRVYYYGSYPLFLAALPGVYATYWWGSVPYYYVNNVYYTWSAPDAGYVVTDPPPMLSNDDLGAIEAEAGFVDDTASTTAAPPPPADNPGPGYGPGPRYGAPPPVQGTEIYAYPRNGQSPDQQARDKFECHQWARQQSNYDPTNPGYGAAGGPENYRRAMIACLQARGYSAN